MSQNEPPTGGNAPDPGQQPYQPQQTPGQFGSPDSGAWQGQPPGYPPQSNPPGYPPSSTTPGYPPQSSPPGGQPPGYPPSGTTPGYPPQGNPAQGSPPGYPPQGPPPGWQQQPPGYGTGAGAGPQAPYGAQGGYGSQQQPWGTPPPGQQPPSKGPNKVLLGAVGGVVGLALIGVGFWAVRGNGGTAAPSPQPTVTTGTGQTSQPSPPPNPAASKASDAVATYLRALGAGDALTALSLAATPPGGNTAFLTNGVLAKATAGKISDINVPEVADPNATDVPATYTLAGKPVSASFGVTRIGDQFRLSQVAATIDISRLQNPRVPVSLGGVAATSSLVQLFPGVYPVAAANKYYSYGSVQLTVGDLGDKIAGKGTVSISSAGKSAIIKAAKAKYKSCLKQHAARPSGCGWGVRVPGGVKIRTSTVKWTTKSGANWDKLKLKLIGPGLVEGRGKATVHFYARDARVSGRYWYKDIKLTGVQASINGSKIKVTFY